MAAADQDGTLLMNKRVTNDFETIAKEFAAFPKDAKYVLESSSVWYGVYKKLAVDMGLDVVLSNPYLTRMIAVSKKKTDKFDAQYACRHAQRRIHPHMLHLTSGHC